MQTSTQLQARLDALEATGEVIPATLRATIVAGIEALRLAEQIKAMTTMKAANA